MITTRSHCPFQVMAPKRWRLLSIVTSLTRLRPLSTPDEGPVVTPDYQSPFTEDDVLFLILGQTGVGKSSFINYALGREAALVGHNLESETSQIKHYFTPATSTGGSRFVLVDTPGFNDTYLSDRRIMHGIVVWLRDQCMSKMKFAGIIYLHDITQARENPETNLMHPTKLSPPEAPKHLILVTVKWGFTTNTSNEDVRELRKTQCETREKELKTHWKKMSDAGSLITRFEDSKESARKILGMIQAPPMEMQEIAKELGRIFGMLPELPEERTLGDAVGFISRLFGKAKRALRRPELII